MSPVTKGYKLPETIDPEGVRCIRVYVPDDPLYIAAFWGAYEFFTSWLAWERDSEHRGLAAAAVWKVAFEQSREEYLCNDGGCGVMDVRQNPEGACQLQKKIACDDWQSFADLRLCVPRMRFLNGVLQQDTTGSGDWEDASDPEEPYDDRNSGAYTPAWENPPSGQDGACLAALNAIAFSRGIVSAYANLIDGGANLITTTLYWFSSLQVIAAISSIIIEATVTLQGLMTGFSGDWADVASYDYTDDVLCILQGAYSGDGSMTGESWAGIGSAMEAEALEHSTESERTAIRLASLVFFVIGPVGMSRVANFAGIVSGDCSECGIFHHTFDFAIDEQGFEPAHEEGYPYSGVYSAGNGWRPVYGLYNDGYVNRLNIWSPTVPDFTATKTMATYSMGANVFLCFTVNYLDGSGGAVTVEWKTGDATLSWEGEASCDRFRVGGENSYEGQVITLSKYEVWGVGDDPFV